MPPLHSILAAVLLLVLELPGALLKVPEHHPTIQGAIDATAPFDTVLVGPGRYFENLLVPANGILLSSRTLFDGDTLWVERTVVDGGYLDRVLQVMGEINMHGPSPEVRGLTLQRGRGGLSASNAGLILRQAVVQDNEAYTGGGLLFTTHGSSEVALEDVTFRRNRAVSGGAIHAELGTGYDSLFIRARHCCFTENHAYNSGGVISGVVGTGQVSLQASFSDCLLEGNVSAGSGGVAHAQASTGQATIRLDFDDSRVLGNRANRASLCYTRASTGDARVTPHLSGSEVRGNSAGFGGVIQMSAGTGQARTELELENTPLVDNRSWKRGEPVLSIRGGISSAMSTARLERVLFAGNQVDHGPVIQVSGSASTVRAALSLVHCTLAGNQGLAEAALSIGTADVYAVNSVLWQPGVPEILAVGSLGGLALSHCLVEDGEDGVSAPVDLLRWEEGNLSLAPVWLEDQPGLYLPALDSPALDAGVVSYVPDWGLFADTQLAPQEHFAGAGPDLGWREVDARDLPPTWPVSRLPGLSAWPNPFNGPLTVRFHQERPGPVRLDLVDLAGRRLRRLDLSAGPGWQVVSLEDGGLAAGMYFLRLSRPGRDEVVRVTRMP